MTLLEKGEEWMKEDEQGMMDIYTLEQYEYLDKSFIEDHEESIILKLPSGDIMSAYAYRHLRDEIQDILKRDAVKTIVEIKSLEDIKAEIVLRASEIDEDFLDDVIFEKELPVERVDEYLDDDYVAPPANGALKNLMREQLGVQELSSTVTTTDEQIDADETWWINNGYTYNSVLKDLTVEPEPQTADKVRNVFSSMSDLIDEKNKRYGDSVMTPLGVFSSHVFHDNTESLNGVLIRLDDKLKRIKNSDELRKNDVSDLIGYLGFLCVEKGWENFDDLID